MLKLLSVHLLGWDFDHTIVQLLSLIYFRTFEGVIDEPSKEYAFSYIDTRLDMFERMSNNV